MLRADFFLFSASSVNRSKSEEPIALMCVPVAVLALYIPKSDKRQERCDEIRVALVADRTRSKVIAISI